jgi:hypothetical protein
MNASYSLHCNVFPYKPPTAYVNQLSPHATSARSHYEHPGEQNGYMTRGA